MVRAMAFRLSSRLAILLILVLPGNAVAASSPGRVFRRMLAPFRSHPILQAKAGPCRIGDAQCGKLLASTEPTNVKLGADPVAADPDHMMTMELRTLRRGPFCHHWLRLETTHGLVTMGYGPATVPLIDAGEVGVRDEYGNYAMLSGMHLVPMLAMPPVNYHYAKAMDRGRIVGKPMYLTAAQADATVQRELHHRFIFPYIPLFHDCRTYVCTVASKAQGKSSIPCYLLFKGYW